MNIIIAGGGVAGLTAAAALRRLPFVRSIIVFEPVRPSKSGHVDHERNIESTTNIVSSSKHFNGLWGPSLRCLESLDIYGNIKDHLHAVRQSGYKDVSGRWLAQPTVGLKEPPGISCQNLCCLLHCDTTVPKPILHVTSSHQYLLFTDCCDSSFPRAISVS